MKKILKKIMPPRLLYLYKKIKFAKFAEKKPKDVFTEIYTTNHWKSSESISGTGSELTQTESLVKDLDKLIVDMSITSILDIPCGDFRWMQNVNLSKVNYIGADIVEDIIKLNIEKHEKNNIKFKVIDLINDPLPKSDLIITRDCLVHLSYKDINKAIENIRNSGCKYLLTTTFTDCHSNYDIITGDWRRLNFQDKPFDFSNPILIINENCTEGKGEQKDKSMALWEISKI